MNHCFVIYLFYSNLELHNCLVDQQLQLIVGADYALLEELSSNDANKKPSLLNLLVAINWQAHLETNAIIDVQINRVDLLLYHRVCYSLKLNHACHHQTLQRS